MPSFVRRYSTPFITGFFLISLLSGVALFFHWYSSLFHGMHEWLSMVLILPFILHLWRNWGTMVGYFRHPPFAIAMAVSLVAALAFVVPALKTGGGVPPQMALVQKILSNPPETVAPLLGKTPDELITVLKAKGFSAAAPALPLHDIAQKAGREDFDIIRAALSP